MKIQNSRRRRGAILPLMAFVLTAILLVVALTMNSNWFLYNQINAQNAADLSARSSLAKVLTDSEADGRIDRARDLGQRLYNLNFDRPDVDFNGDRIQFGHLVDSTQSEPVFIENTTDDEAVSAVFVDTPDQQEEVEVILSNLFSGPDEVRIVADATVSTRPIDIMLCLDVSRSMNRTSTSSRGLPPGGRSIHEPPIEGSRYFELRDTIIIFLAAMREINPNAQVGLVTFGGGYGRSPHISSPLDDDWARIEQPLTAIVSPQADHIVETLDSYVELPALGLGTSHFDGIGYSIDAFTGNNLSARHMIMLSDGDQATRNERPDVRVNARKANREDITIHTISFGGNFATMEDIAELTGGSNFTALSEDELKDAFASLLARFRVQLVD